MTVQHNPAYEAKVDINPYVSGLASRLIRSATNAELPMDSDGWELISEILSYAASAEQRMSEQHERIAYLEHLSVTDELTGVTNRRGLKNALGRILANAARHGEEGVLAFLDLDGFKRINDEHGHDAGDAVLRKVALFLRKEIRPQDLVARISGDEFAIVLTRCDIEGGKARLNKIQSRLNATTIEYGGLEIPVASSIGMHPYSGGSDPAELIKLADQAMYLDKEARKQTQAPRYRHSA